MGEVRQFPTKDTEKEGLYKVTQDLDQIYDAINKLHGALNELELRAAEVESMYDVALDNYVRRIGVENVPVHLLDYSMKSVDYYYEWKNKQDE